jgi:hypothetical protein
MRIRPHAAALHVVLVTTLTLGVVACDEGTDKSVPALEANDQPLALSTAVRVDRVTSVGPGWIVIHEDDLGSPGAVLGRAAVESGMSEDVAVGLDRRATDGEGFIAMLHQDLGAVGTWEPAVDLPAEDDGIVVVSGFAVVVAASTPDVRITVTNIGGSAYNFTTVLSTRFADIVGPEGDNQTLTLLSGWRYEIVNLSSEDHPFELITLGATPSEDVVLLSQDEDVAGSLEGDADIDWFDDANQTVRFTVVDALTADVDGYRCSIHTATMRGSFVFTP